jgi:predicted DNA-binding transcriptional regulator YafY
MTEKTERIRWGTERRLEFIEFRAFWEGGVNRGEITERFGVSVPQASSDLSLYQSLVPDNLVYDSSRKRYVATAHFVPRFLRPSAEQYLMQLRSVAEDVIDLADTWMSRAPESDAMPIPQARVQPAILKELLEVMREGLSIEINYQSLSLRNPDRLWRRITPHAFGFDGMRWHVRAFCHLDHTFKDFILSRCGGVRERGASGASGTDDLIWNEFFVVILHPHPKLSASQRQAIELDYNMEGGALRINVRLALLFYFNKRLRLDIATPTSDPQQNHLVVANATEYEAALRRASGRS